MACCALSLHFHLEYPIGERTGKIWCQGLVQVSPKCLPLNPGEGPGNRGRLAERIRETAGGRPAPLQSPPCGPHTVVVHQCWSRILLELLEGNLLPKRFLDRSCLHRTFVIKSLLSISFMKPGLPSVWLYIKRNLTLVSPSPITLLLLSSHGPGPGKLVIILGCRH